MENYNFIQSGNGYLEFDIKFKKHDNNNFSITGPGHDVIRLVITAFAYTLYGAGLSTSSGVGIEQNKFIGAVSKIFRLFTQKDGDISTCFDKIDEIEAGIDDSSLKQIFINNHTEANRDIIRVHLPLEYMFGFCKLFKKMTKRLGFE